jgi:hypothetical protein
MTNFSSSPFASVAMPWLTDAQCADVLGQVVDRISAGGAATLAFVVAAANDVVGNSGDGTTAAALSAASSKIRRDEVARYFGLVSPK